MLLLKGRFSERMRPFWRSGGEMILPGSIKWEISCNTNRPKRRLNAGKGGRPEIPAEIFKGAKFLSDSPAQGRLAVVSTTCASERTEWQNRAAWDVRRMTDKRETDRRKRTGQTTRDATREADRDAACADLAA